MAQNFQNSTLSLTLPISCQICLGKVRQPVICANNHVFCSTCMQIWLKKASQCPTCRAPITAQNPCREIIGGTNEGEHSDSPSVKKHLRKTRGELLLKEYEDEIEGLLKENEDLKAKNESLESQLKTALDPCNITVAQREDQSIDPSVVEEWTNKLRAATDLYSKVKQDMEKLKEANKTLRSQNIDLVQENLQLKAEVSSRSPQKFGRYTVAALEAKIHQYERDVNHLKRALERSDQYIEDLESKVTDTERRRAPAQQNSPLPCTATSGNAGDESEGLPEHQTIKMMTRSLSDIERASICTNPEQECPTLPVISGFLPGRRAFREVLSAPRKDEDMDSATSDLFLPSTPSSAFRSLTLKSPGLRSEKKVAFKSISYLRRLSFEDVTAGPGSNNSNCGSATFSADTKVDPSKSAYWGTWTNKPSNRDPCHGQSTEGELLVGLETRSLAAEAASGAAGSDDSDSLQMASEASMDVAYLNKISELDSMMLDGESSSSRGSLPSSLASPPPSVDFDVALVQEQADVKSEARRRSEGPAPGRASARGAGSEDGARRLAGGGSPDPSQSEELLFDLLFETKAGASSSPQGDHYDVGQEATASVLSPSSSSSSGGTGKPGNTSRDKQTVTTGHPIKRSHSPFSSSSPTKLSKLM